MSFSDLMSSGRGPGVIGMLLALMVLVGFGGLAMFAFDERFLGGGPTIESRIAEQAREIDRSNWIIAEAEAKLAGMPALQAAEKKLSAVKHEIDFRAAKITNLKQIVEDASRKLGDKTAEFEAYKDDYREFVRGGAKGQTLESLTTRDGRVYQDVTIREVTAIGVQIRHADGFKRIAFEDLGDDIQDYYQFDPKQKEAAISNEAAARARHESAVFATREMVAEKAAAQKLKEEQEERAQTTRAIAVLGSRIESVSREIATLEQAIAAEQFKTISRAPQMRAELAAKQRSLASMRTEVIRLRSKP